MEAVFPSSFAEAADEDDELISDQVNLDFDIQAATETILPYVLVNQSEPLNEGFAAISQTPAPQIAGNSLRNSETLADTQAFSNRGRSTRSSSSDPPFALMSLGLEESLPPQELQDDL